MPYECAIHRIPEMSILSIRARVDEAGFPGFLGAAFPELFSHIGAHGVIVAGSPFVIYHAFGPDGIDAEVCAPVAGPVPTTERIEAHTLAATTVVRTLHTGPYDDLGAAYAALQKWVGDHGYVAVGPHRERYLTGPDTSAPPSDYRTEVDLPIAAAGVAAAAEPAEPMAVG